MLCTVKCEHASIHIVHNAFIQQLPKELDFVHEGRNAERAAAYLKDARLDKDCIIPEVFWGLTTARGLTMQFEEGFKSTDINSIDNAGLKRW